VLHVIYNMTPEMERTSERSQRDPRVRIIGVGEIYGPSEAGPKHGAYESNAGEAPGHQKQCACQDDHTRDGQDADEHAVTLVQWLDLFIST
jgi:hypothetical protein